MTTPMLVTAREATEGAGVRIRRAIGTPELRALDPFLMLDYFDNDDASDYLAGFPDHPHRGFVTLTYMLAGRMEHRDSIGNAGVIGPGDAQWMKAARGVIHSEMPKQVAGRMAGFQLWINLPASQKMSEPAYQEFAAADFPRSRDGGVEVRVLAGAFGEAVGPIRDPHTDVHFLDVSLGADGLLRWTPPPGQRGFLFAYEGGVAVDRGVVRPGQLAVVADGLLTARVAPAVDGDGGSGVRARFIVVTGRPIGEPIAQLGPFVMNTREEIEQAVIDYRSGRLVRPAA